MAITTERQIYEARIRRIEASAAGALWRAAQRKPAP